MAEIPVFTNDIPVATPRTVLADPAAMAQSAEALSHGAAAVSDEMANFNARYLEARRASDAANISAGASGKLNDAQFRWSKTPDRMAAISGFNDEARNLRQQTLAAVTDPAVARYVAQSFDREAIARSFETGNQAFALESAKRRGDLDLNLAQYAQNAAAAGTPELRALQLDAGVSAIHGAVAGGWYRPDEAAPKELTFRSQVEDAAVRAASNAARDSGDPAMADALVRRLGDPKEFASLLPERREIQERNTLILRDELMRRAAERQGKEDAAADRKLRQTQNHNATQLLADVFAGKPVSPATVYDMASRGDLSEGGLSIIEHALERRDRGNPDHAQSALALWSVIGDGHGSVDDVAGALKAGLLSGNTAAEMVKAIGARDRQQATEIERGAYNTLKTITSGTAVEQGLIKDDTVRARAEQLWSQAQGEWSRRVVSGREDPFTVLSDMAPRYASAMPAHPSWLPQPKFGAVYSLEDVKKIAAATQSAYQQQQLSEADYQNEGRVLDAYRAFYAAAAARNAATVIPLRPGSTAQKKEGAK